MDRKQLKVILLLDDFSRSNIRTNVSELLLYGVTVITDLRELNDAMVEKTNSLIVMEDALKNDGLYSDLVLYKEVFGLEYIFLSLDESLIKSMSGISKCYRIDPVFIDYEKIHSILTEDVGMVKTFEANDFDKETSDIKLANTILTDDSYDLRIKRLAERLISLEDLLSLKEGVIRELKEDLESKTLLIDQHKDYINNIQGLYFDMIGRAVDMSRSLKQFETILSKDVYDKVQLSRYPNRPRVIYLKEYQELIHLNSFVSTLFEMFRYQGKNSVKVVRLYDSSSSKKRLPLPKYYKVLHNFSKRDVVHDFIAKVGGYRELLDTILTNSSALDLLIIVDCKDHNDVVLSGQFLQLAMCRNPNNMSVYGLNPDFTIVNGGNTKMSWGHYEEYSKLNDSERFLFLSSRPVMQTIFELDSTFNR